MELHPLRAHRKAKNLSLEDMALSAETTIATISRIELGRRAPSFALAARLSRVTGIPLKEFLPPETVHEAVGEASTEATP